MSRVRCYAGSSSPERPVAFERGNAWLEITEIVRRERTPTGLRFRVLAADGRNYYLQWTEATDKWQVETATTAQ